MREEPHSRQNFAPGGFGWLHWGHFIGRDPVGEMASMAHVRGHRWRQAPAMTVTEPKRLDASKAAAAHREFGQHQVKEPTELDRPDGTRVTSKMHADQRRCW